MKQFFYFLGLLLVTSCASVPPESINLSQAIGRDIAELERSHLQLVDIHYKDLKGKINTYIDQVYAPFIINYVLRDELTLYQSGSPSLYTSIIAAGESADSEVTSHALEEMTDFLEAARAQIDAKRAELLDPIEQQQIELRSKIHTAYSNTLSANATLTAYLQSVRNVKDAQGRALTLIGIEGADEKITDNLVRASDEVSHLIEEAKKIDLKGEDVYQKFEDISNQIKKVTNKE